MSTVRRAAAGATRTCPHCRTVILQSAARLSGMQETSAIRPVAATTVIGGEPAAPSFSPLRIEGSIRHPDAGEAWEYSVVVSIKNERGDEVARQVVGVGALQPGEARTFSVSVDVYKPD